MRSGFLAFKKKKLKAGIIVFLGTNCDRDTKFALEAAGFRAEYVFHTETELSAYDLIVLPGGFSFGDYIRAGRLAKLSPVVFALKEYVKKGKGFVFGICNGFQILCEAGFLPGALVENASTRFISRDEKLIFMPNAACDVPFGSVCREKTLGGKTSGKKTPGGAEAFGEEILSGETLGEEIILPIAHKEGSFYADSADLARIVKENMVFLRYKNNPNGSLGDIAGLYDRKQKVMGMMPHPERAMSRECAQSDRLDGFKVFNFIKAEILNAGGSCTLHDAKTFAYSIKEGAR